MKSLVSVVKLVYATKKFLQGDYTISSLYHQLKLPLDIEISIPSDDPVRLLSAFVEGMDLSDLYATYDRIRKKYQKRLKTQLRYTGERSLYMNAKTAGAVHTKKHVLRGIIVKHPLKTGIKKVQSLILCDG